MHHGTGGVTSHSTKMAKLGVPKGHRVMQVEGEVVGGNKQGLSHCQEFAGSGFDQVGPGIDGF